MKFLKSWGLPLLAVVLTCVYPCVFIYSQNAGEAKASDMLLFMGIFLGTAMVILTVFGLIFRNMSRAAFMTGLAMLVVINFSLVSGGVEKLLPWFHAKYLLALVAVLGLGLTILLVVKKPDLNVGCVLLALTFGALTVVSLVTAVPKVIEAASYVSAAQENQMGNLPSPDPVPQEEAETAETEAAEEKPTPNVYYLLFDEYGGDANLTRYFDFDNQEFYTALEERGFQVSHSTYNTESLWTDTLVPNLLNLDYVVEDQMPAKARREYLKNPYLVEFLREKGYAVNVINHRAYLRIKGARELTTDQREDNISEYLLDNSLYSKVDFLDSRIRYELFATYRDNYEKPLRNCFEELVNCYQETGDGPTLTISYIQAPHAPFVFDGDGNVRELSTGWFWKDETLYPQQLQYVNQLILETVDNIQSHDPDAVILLMGDHGARVPLHMVEQFGGPRFDVKTETLPMQNALCAVCVPGTDLDIEGMSGINAARTALNGTFGTSLEMIPQAEGYVLEEMFNAKKNWDRKQWMPEWVEVFAVEEPKPANGPQAGTEPKEPKNSEAPKHPTPKPTEAQTTTGPKKPKKG